jgi:acetyl-CoA synthetase
MEQKKLSGEVFYPPEETVKESRVPDWDVLAKKAELDYLGFWEREADQLNWFREWDKVLDDSEKPFYKWFVGAKTNIVYNCLDRHLQTARRNKLALIWEGENGDFRSFSYFALRREGRALRQCAEKPRS